MRTAVQQSPIRKDRKPLYELIPLNRPLRVLIDPSSACNFKCRYCIHGNGIKIGEIMSERTLALTLEQLCEFDEKVNIIHFFGLGEPLLNRNIDKFIKMAKEIRGGAAQECALTTNASLLTRHLSDRLIDARPDRITISINGLSDEQYLENTGARVNFQDLYENIQYLAKIASGVVHIHIKIIGDYYSEDDRQKFIDLFSGHADTINIDHLQNGWPRLDVMNRPSVDMYSGEEVRQGSVCTQMFYSLMINSDGSVSPCSYDYNYKQENLGSVHSMTLKNIWNSQKLWQMRKGSLTGHTRTYAICKDCLYPNVCIGADITPYRGYLLHKLWPGEF